MSTKNLTWSEPLSVGIAGMDAHHQAFIEACNGANAAAEGADFQAAFQGLLEHLQAHFAYEEGLMEEYGFPAFSVHRGEHQRVLAEMRDLAGSIQRGRLRMARLYLQEKMPEWFLTHRDTMDLVTAGFLQSKGLA